MNEYTATSTDVAYVADIASKLPVSGFESFIKLEDLPGVNLLVSHLAGHTAIHVVNDARQNFDNLLLAVCEKPVCIPHGATQEEIKEKSAAILSSAVECYEENMLPA